MKKNVKGFTLIELLAVIVILAILVAVAVPAVTRYLNSAREGSMKNEASELINTARTYLVSQNVTSYGVLTYTVGSMNASWAPTGGSVVAADNLLQKNLAKSPYGNEYKAAKVTVSATGYAICLTDGVKTIKDIAESNVQGDAAVTDFVTGDCGYTPAP